MEFYCCPEEVAVEGDRKEGRIEEDPERGNWNQ